jgi:A/G-specific adenine glycosylase
VFAYGERAAILDGNVKRVLSRAYGVGEAQLWKLAQRLLPESGIEAYTQGLMDLGATVCKRIPECGTCPVKARCVARKTGRIAELPAPRAKKALPWRRVSWFVFIRQGQILLERRPAPGIWGGLWCFPERRPSRCRVMRKLPVIEHGFTHFRLRIQPLLCSGGPAGLGLWMDLDDAGRAAIPTPVRNLLHDLPRIVTPRGGPRR